MSRLVWIVSPLNLSVSSSHSDEEAGLIRECFPNVDKPQVDTNVSAALNPGSTAGEEICTAILAGLQQLSLDDNVPAKEASLRDRLCTVERGNASLTSV